MRHLADVSGTWTGFGVGTRLTKGITLPSNLPERSTSRRTLLLAVAVAVIVSIPAAAVANHVFSDVADGDVHAPGIEYVADTGVTAGCTPTTYCPTDRVTRAQMATFLHRSSGNAAGIAPNVTAAALAGIERLDAPSTVGIGSTANPATIACPAGKVAVGGGGSADIGWVLKDSHPLPDLVGWRVQHRTADGLPIAAESTSTIYVVCAPAP